MSGGKKKASIKSTITQPMLIVLVVQVMVIFLVIYFGGVITSLKESSYDIFDKRSDEVVDSITGKFNAFKIKDESYNIINNKLKNVKTKKEANAAFLKIEEEMASMLGELDVDGSFVILNDINKIDSEKVGIFIRKRDNNLFLRVGSLELVQNLALMIDGDSWSETFRFTKDTKPLSIYRAYVDTYNKVYNKASVEKNRDFRDYEYWSRARWFLNDGPETFTYTLPLMNDRGSVYGVVGVEISQAKLKEVFTKDNSIGTGIYPLIGTVQKQYEGNNNKISQELALTGLFGVDDYSYNITIDPKEDLDNIYKVTINKESANGLSDEDNLFASIHDLKVYDGSGVFKNEELKILNVITKDELFKTQNKLMRNLTIGISISMLFGIIIVIATATVTVKPIEGLADEVKRINPSKMVKLKRTNIKQLDDLAYSIENLSKNVIENASKLSSIIDLVNMPIGAFEYYDNSNMVYCTDSFFKVTGVEREGDEDLFINMEKFKKILADITKERVPNEKNVYKIIKDNNEQFIRVKMLINDSKTLGVIVDVTDDILKKQKIEYERDHDVLTGLYNRIAFKREVTAYMKRPPKDKVAAFLMWDLDSLKYMNDTFGHELGDRYIKMAAESIDKFTNYGGVSGRIGGDEFTAFIGGFDTKDEIRQIINKVKRDFEATEIELPNGTSKQMRASMGVAWYPQDSMDYEEINKYADYAMYEVKKTTKGALKEFDIRTYKEIEEEDY